MNPKYFMREKKKINIITSAQMGRDAATAHSDRSHSLTGTETEGHTAESTGLITLT